jgi:ELWxxDGT repeat protein
MRMLGARLFLFSSALAVGCTFAPPSLAETFHPVTSVAPPERVRPIGVHGNAALVYSRATDGGAGELRAIGAAGDTHLASLGSYEWVDRTDAMGTVNGRLVFRNRFSSSSRLWATAGTPATTGPIGDAAPRVFGDAFTALTPTEAWLAQRSTTLAKLEIWSTDGTAAGTQKRFTVAAKSSDVSTGASFLRAGTTPVVIAMGDSNGTDVGVWRWDGTSATKSLATKQLMPNGVACGGKVYVELTPFGVSTMTPGWWQMDGTATPPTMVEPLTTQDGGGAVCLGGTTFLSGSTVAKWAFGANLSKMAAGWIRPAGNRAYLSAVLDYGTPTQRDVIYVTDGTAAGTVLLVETPWQTTAERNGLYAVSASGRAFGVNGGKLLFTDGTVAGTITSSIDATLDTMLYPPGVDMFAAGASLYMWMKDGAHGVEPWVTDFTEAGTRMLADIRPGPEGSFVTGAGWNEGSSRNATAGIFVAGDDLLLLADDGTTGPQIRSTRALATGDPSTDAGTTDPGSSPGGSSAPPAGGSADVAPPIEEASQSSCGCSVPGAPQRGGALFALAIALYSIIAVKRSNK